jgi:ATP/maltotriose-dependent transcriptional regulator MalT
MKLLEGQILALRGDLDKGHLVLAEAMHSDSSHGAAEAAAWAASVALWMGEPDLVREAAARYMEMPAPGRMFRILRTQAHANLAAADGRVDEALGLYRQAASDWRESGVVLSLGLLSTDMAVALDRSNPEVAAAAEEAREIWTRLGAAPLLARLAQPMPLNRGTTGSPSPRDRSNVRAEESASA